MLLTGVWHVTRDVMTFLRRIDVMHFCMLSAYCFCCVTTDDETSAKFAAPFGGQRWFAGCRCRGIITSSMSLFFCMISSRLCGECVWRVVLRNMDLNYTCTRLVPPAVHHMSLRVFGPCSVIWKACLSSASRVPCFCLICICVFAMMVGDAL